ncbi:MAG: phage terminase large subunit family protein [Armatimonadetes bacterium]|nr:phage terminase large subunit family protein [Armatimonadota bacterium]MDW8122418.1 phage terminase large subunit family protein [Armatimonadota bacterium]
MTTLRLWSATFGRRRVLLDPLRDAFWSLKDLGSRLIGLVQKSPKRVSRPRQDDPIAFLCSLRLPDGRAYRLDDHDDLIAIAADRSQVVIVEKAAQKGVTELMIRLQFWLARRGYSSGYFLKSVPYMRLQVQRRVEPLIAANPVLLKALVSDPLENQSSDSDAPQLPKKYRLRDNVRLKKLWNGWCFYMGLQSEADVRMVPLDAIFVDEVETLKPELTVALQERLYHSSLKWERWFSQPTAVGFGIDERFAMSDQRFWHLQCPQGHWFNLEESFPAVLMGTDRSGRKITGSDWDPSSWKRDWEWSYCCPDCQTELPDLMALKKEWVAKYPDREIRGYHLSQLYSPTMTAGEVASLWHRAQFSIRLKERFVNSVLGFPYAGGERQPITAERCFYGDHSLGILDPAAVRVAGVDVGDSNHLVVLEAGADGRLRVIWIEELKGPGKWEAIKHRVEDLKVKAIGINAMPYKDSAKKLVRELAPKVKGMLIYDTATKGTTVGEEDKEFGQPVKVLNINRTELMDGTVDAITTGKIVLPRRGLRETESLVRHLMNYIIEINAQGERTYVRGREDHFGRALDYARVVGDLKEGLGIGPTEPLSGWLLSSGGASPEPSSPIAHLQW